MCALSVADYAFMIAPRDKTFSHTRRPNRPDKKPNKLGRQLNRLGKKPKHVLDKKCLPVKLPRRVSWNWRHVYRLWNATSPRR
jgi:hypothetical protein